MMNVFGEKKDNKNNKKNSEEGKINEKKDLKVDEEKKDISKKDEVVTPELIPENKKGLRFAYTCGHKGQSYKKGDELKTNNPNFSFLKRYCK